jgi:murein DD-endopeptidase MepM/ murein hydrolase activator NlpD
VVNPSLVVASTIATPQPAVTAFQLRTYRVVKGDTLYSIAARFDLEVRDLLLLNDIDDPRDVAEGTVLNLEGVRPRTTGTGGPRLWPTDGELKPLTGKLDGIAIRGAPGQPVRSVSSGTVAWSGPRRGYGYVVLVRKDRYVYGYLNNEQVLVTVGDQVQVGSEIAQLGVNPHDNTAQLYFVVLKDGRFIDPGSAPRA